MAATATIKFPMASPSMVANELAVVLDGTSALGQLQIRDGALELAASVQKGWTANLDLQFKTRGVSTWYFQVTEARVIRDFNLILHLPDLPQEKLNYPEGCMTPTEISATGNGRGCDLRYELGDAVSSKGMGIALAQPPQPGKTMNAVLSETSTAWTLLFAVLVCGLALAGIRHGVLYSLFFGVVLAIGYAILGNCHDILFGFWGSAAMILLPWLVLLSLLVARVAPGPERQTSRARSAGFWWAVPVLGRIGIRIGNRST